MLPVFLVPSFRIAADVDEIQPAFNGRVVSRASLRRIAEIGKFRVAANPAKRAI
ncbi:Uncharacterised protein [Bordetella pertussis]|nr:Uncharacterised protein [Bordetella pertussis]